MKVKKLTFFWLFVLLIITSCNSGHDYVFNHDNVYVMSHPSQANLNHFVVKGGVASAEILGSNESSQTSKVGSLAQSQYQWDIKALLPKAQLDQLVKSLGAAGGKPVLIHSSDNQKSSGTLALYLYYSGHSELDEAIKVAKDAGLHAGSEKSIREYVKANPKK